jgi:hypothetical protein
MIPNSQIQQKRERTKMKHPKPINESVLGFEISIYLKKISIN